MGAWEFRERLEGSLEGRSRRQKRESILFLLNILKRILHWNFANFWKFWDRRRN
jgi:hypothetical protein